MPYTESSTLLRRILGGLLALGLLGVACQSPEFRIPVGTSGTASDDTGGSGGMSTTDGSSDGSGGSAGAGGAMQSHCDNGVADADEGGADCGGRDCERCRVGEPCKLDTDCENDECTQGVCRDASCTDDFRNGSETDLDCGGGDCPRCAPGYTCNRGSDCTSDHCSDEMICEAASCTDRIVNGNETDIDCGGSCPACEVGSSCVVTDDCESPPNEQTGNASCNEDSEVCELLCANGSADCNQLAGDGCEVALNVDILNCGACGEMCDLANAEAQCQGGTCQIVSCTDGFRNCNNLAEDGCEVDLLADPLNCGECGAWCSDRNGEAACEQGTCAIECGDGFADCNDSLVDGCEANLNRSVDHCGECEALCLAEVVSATPFCTEAQGCGETECEAGLGDCDGDGECEDELTSVADCGRCGNECHVPHGTPACEESACVIATCDSGEGGTFEDCDGIVANGCERNLDTDRRFCGDCATDCTAILSEALHVTDVGCMGAGCVVTSCEVGFADCDGDFANGCEVDLASDAEQCGGCAGAGGVDCTAEYANGTGSCVDAACSFDECDETFADCNQNAGAGSLRDGCETSIAFNEEHCGACGVTCQVGVGTQSNTCGGALGDTCLPTCVQDYADCDTIPANGCEAALLSDTNHCGACGSECQDSNSDNECVEGTCVPDCDDDYLSCNDDPNDGCEQSVLVIAHCGDCDDSCSAAGGGVAACSSEGECSVTCSGTNKSCNDEDVARDGCETNTLTNPNHCGGCGQNCAATNVTTRTCTAGECTPTCESGFCPAANPALGCTVPLGTPNNCASCGHTCPEPTPFCASDGGFHCDFLDIEVVNNDTIASNAWNATGTLSVTHSLEGSQSDYRAVLLGIGALAEPLTVSYGDVLLDQPEIVNETYSDNWSAVYVLLEAQLPTQASPQVTVQFDEWGWGQLSVVQLSGVDQNDPIVATGVGSGAACGAGSLRGVGVTFSTVPGSFVYSVMSGRQASAATLMSGGYAEAYNAVSASPDGAQHGFLAAAVSGPQANGSTAQWNMVDCYNSAGVAIGIRRAESL